MKKTKKIKKIATFLHPPLFNLFFILFIFSLSLFVGCESSLRFTPIMSAGVIKGARFQFKCNAATNDEINPKELKSSLEETGIKSVHIKRNKDGLLIEGNIALKNNPLADSGFLVFDPGLKIEIRRETLRSLYDLLPEDLQGQFDLLMPPVTMDDKMNDEEYLSAMEGLYGAETRDLLEEGVISISLGEKLKSLPIIRILNCSDDFIIE